MKRNLLVVFMSVFCIAALASATTIEPFVQEDQDIGIVLMHGKNGTPHGYIATLAGSLRRAGLQVETPEMPWSKNRIYAKSYDDSMLEIDEAVNRLKSKGAIRIVIAGQSLGANAALGYAARREGLSGVIVLAAGHFPSVDNFQKKTGYSWKKAKKMVDAGKGEKRGRFADINQGRRSKRSTTANIFLSWFDPNGPAVFRNNAKSIKEGTALLWVSGTSDHYAMIIGTSKFDLAPKNARNKYVQIDADHRNTPTKSINIVSEWLRSLP
jgi:pimeloyl-ACP methyl ester carboxylesterase